jgi:hypothetical protein
MLNSQWISLLGWITEARSTKHLLFTTSAGIGLLEHSLPIVLAIASLITTFGATNSVHLEN